MCGISGLVTENPLAREIIGKMNTLIHHRGPDQDGIFTDTSAGVFLGHKRLSIVDLSDMGRQPMVSECGRFSLVFNGEIYNYLELKGILRQRGHQFQSSCDTEVLLKSFLEWGVACLQRLNGMFAFALYDQKEEKVFLVRDRIGEKPLYFSSWGSHFAFASEMKAFLALDPLGFHFQLDPLQVQRFMGFMWLPNSGATMIRQIERLQPGEIVEYDIKTKRLKREHYWELKIDPNIARMDFKQAVATYEELLDDSVRLRLQADVPVGIMLSGGLDSSIIAALAQKHTQRSVSTFTLKFDNKYSEEKYAKLVSGHIGSHHHELLIETSNLFEKLKDIIYYFDDLTTVDGGLITTILMGNVLKENGVKVILLGEGSDEINAGYGKFSFSKFPFSVLPSCVRNTAYYYAMSRYPLLKPDFFKHARFVNKAINSSPGDSLQQFTKFDLTHQLPNHLLMKVDKATMAQSLEARVPFLDHRLVEFVYNLPSKYKLQGKTFSMSSLNEKHLLKKVAAKHLPSQIIQRKKFGMMLPTSEVLRDNKEKIKEELLNSENSVVFDFVSRPEIEKLFEAPRFDFNRNENEWFLWKVFTFHLWSKRFLGTNA